MSEDPDRIDTVTAERLLRRAGAVAPVESQPVADLFAAAAVPARPSELTGEEAAVQAFRDAHLAPESTPRRRSALRGILVKASAFAAVAVIGGGGVAVAAGTGHLPDPRAYGNHGAARATSSAKADGKRDEHNAHATRRSSGPPAASNSTHRPAASQSAEPGGRSPSGKPDGRHSRSLRRLCMAFLAQAAHDPARAFDDPAFNVLIEKAGGRHEVAAYCGKLLARPDGRPPAHRDRVPEHPSWHPRHPKNDPNRRHPPAPSAPTSHIP